jgi:UDPglucose--hexose-1-phosphate uridylyltransferase
MPDYKFVNIPSLENWIISAPKRAKRPDIHKKKLEKVCPFCPATQSDDKEVYRLGGEFPDKNWSVRVVKNKYPFAPIHEVIVHTPEHVHNLADLSVDQVKLVIEAFVNRFNTHLRHGTVCIFSNAGPGSGESINHSHSQLAVVPKEIPIVVPSLEEFLDYDREFFNVKDFEVVCPPYSQWPDETWIVPSDRGKLFGEITYQEMESLAYILRRFLYIFEARHENKFSYNFYIYPRRDWYLRILPREKIAGGFEIATGIYVNTQDPKDTMDFIKTHFFEEEKEKIKKHKAEYRRGV